MAVWLVLALGIYQCGVTIDFGAGEQSGKGQEENTEPEQGFLDKMPLEKNEKYEEMPFDPDIRVLIKTSRHNGIYHKELRFRGTEGLLIELGDMVTEYAPNEEYCFNAENLKNGTAAKVHSKNQGKIQCVNIERSAAVEYRGVMECYSEPEGIVLINELSVEEYLCGVVPSEMPSSYPIEAQKAQAIGARTYAYYHKKNYAYPQWRAHVDDSTTFQVYLNIPETEEARHAVEETKDLVIAYHDELIQSFYYSTSGGYTAGIGVWSDASYEESDDDFLIETGEEIFAGNSAEGEQRYREYIDSGNERDLEFDEPWYRWTYEMNLDQTAQRLLFQKLYDMYRAQPQKVRIRSKFLSADQLLAETNIKDIRTLVRQKSGLLTSILIETEHFTVNVRTQHCIRQALCAAGGTVAKKDGSTYQLGDILPSAYFYIEKCDNTAENGNALNGEAVDEDILNGNILSKIKIHGAGLGHGAGMSQNGAKCLADQGFTALEILAQYYKGEALPIGSVQKALPANP